MIETLFDDTVSELLKWGVAEGATNTARPLTHPSEQAEGGLAMDASREEWRPIPGYEGFYEVSSIGRVRSLHSGKMRHRALLVQQNHNGYRQISLCRDGRYHKRRVHQLVLEAFVGPRPKGFITRHLNGIRNDNRLDNLTWGTYAENTQDALNHGVYTGRRYPERWNR